MAGWDVVVHFDTKEAAEKFISCINEANLERKANVTYPDYPELMSATYIETLECPR